MTLDTAKIRESTDVFHTPLGQLSVGQLVATASAIVLAALGELLGDDQLGDIHSVAQQIGDGLLGMEQGALRISEHGRVCVCVRVGACAGQGGEWSHMTPLPAHICINTCTPVYEYFVEAGANEIGHE